MDALQNYLSQHGHVLILQVCEMFFVFCWQGCGLWSDFLEQKNSVATFADCKPFCRKIMSCCEEVKRSS